MQSKLKPPNMSSTPLRAVEVIVTGLARSTTEEDVMEALNLQQVAHFSILRNTRTGASNCRGILMFSDEAQADLVLSLPNPVVIDQAEVSFTRVTYSEAWDVRTKRPRPDDLDLTECREEVRRLLVKRKSLKDCADRVGKTVDYVKSELESAIHEPAFYRAFLARLQGMLRSKKAIGESKGNYHREVLRARRILGQNLQEIKALLKSKRFDARALDELAQWLTVLDLETNQGLLLEVLAGVDPSLYMAFFLTLLRYTPLDDLVSFKTRMAKTYQLGGCTIKQDGMVCLLGALTAVCSLHQAKTDPLQAIDWLQDWVQSSYFDLARAVALYTELIRIVPPDVHLRLVQLDVKGLDIQARSLFKARSIQAVEAMVARGQSQATVHAALLHLMDFPNPPPKMQAKLVEISVKVGFTPELHQQGISSPTREVAELEETNELLIELA